MQWTPVRLIFQTLPWGQNDSDVNGSGIGLGHPIGSTGARIIISLIYAMKNRGKSLGLSTLCRGGGVSMACAVEMV